jgi:preprotein translocase subunit YajC
MLSSSLALLMSLLAQAQDSGAVPTDPGEKAPDTGGSFVTFAIFGLMFFVMYLFILRPQKQRESEEKQMLDKLQKNDHVITKGGLYGIVMNVKDDEVTLKIDEQQNVKVRFQKNAIAQIVNETNKPTDEKKA